MGDDSLVKIKKRRGSNVYSAVNSGLISLLDIASPELTVLELDAEDKDSAKNIYEGLDKLVSKLSESTGVYVLSNINHSE